MGNQRQGKFQALIDDVRDLVGRLYQILPFPEHERNAVAIKDIRSLSADLDRLKIFEVASIEKYPVWSGAASVMLEAGSTKDGPGTISQWMEQVETGTEDGSDGDSKPVQKRAEGMETSSFRSHFGVHVNANALVLWNSRLP